MQVLMVKISIECIDYMFLNIFQKYDANVGQLVLKILLIYSDLHKLLKHFGIRNYKATIPPTNVP